MKTILDSGHKPTALPEKVLQFGEGNFLRAFADYLIDVMNEKELFGGSVVICQPIASGLCDKINAQSGLYTLVLRGRENGEAVEKSRVIHSVSRCINPYEDFGALLALAANPELKVIISNTTEAGIAYSDKEQFDDAPPATYPAKLTRFLFERYRTFGGTPESGLLLLPVELIADNGSELKKCVLSYAALWKLGEGFLSWLKEACCFCNTLVDRIVTGFPKSGADPFYEKLGYTDALLDTAEPFFFWAIEAPKKWQAVFPADRSGLNVVFAPDISGYKMRKVRILNGAHTVSVLGAFLSGFDIVRDMMQDKAFSDFLNATVTGEIIPYIPLPEDEKKAYWTSVRDRFDNPFIDHRLLDISLNSVSKFKARCLPSLLDCAAAGVFPRHLLFGLACLIQFYTGSYRDGHYFGTRNGEEYEIRDDKAVLDFFDSVKDSETRVEDILSDTDLWGTDLTAIPGALTFTENCLEVLSTESVKKAMELLS